MRRPGWRLGLVPCLMLLLAACTHATDSFDRDRFNVMLEHGRAGEADLTRVIERLAKDCMEDGGFTVHPLKQEAPPTATAMPAANSDIEVVMGARYMYQSETLDQSGYGASPVEDLGFTPGGADDPFAIDPFSDLAPEDQLDYWLAYDGNYLRRDLPGADAAGGGYETVTVDDRDYRYPRTGCYSDVQNEVFEGEVDGYLRLTHWATEGLGNVAYGEFHVRHEVSVALEDWSDCMSHNGYPDLASPDDAIQSARDLYREADLFGPEDDGFDSVKQQEIDLARADYACNREVELDERLVEIFWSVLEPYVLEHEAEIYGWKELTEQTLERAQALLSS